MDGAPKVTFNGFQLGLCKRLLWKTGLLLPGFVKNAFRFRSSGVVPRTMPDTMSYARQANQDDT